MSATRYSFFPREHGATAMLLTPFVAAAVLAHTVRWQEAAALAAVAVAFTMKDPLVVLARQRWVWKEEHPETRAAMHWLAVETAIVAAGGLVLLATGPLIAYAVLFFGAAAFLALAVWVNVRNRQRAALFQVASALALTSTSLAAALAATRAVPSWCWWLWFLLASQAAAGIFTVHARLDARVAARKSATKGGAQVNPSRRPAFLFAALLALGGLSTAVVGNYWIGSALLVAGAAYAWDLHRQLDLESLQTPLTKVGLQNLSLSLVFAALVIAGLW
jgi:YwiC-like protein